MKGSGLRKLVKYLSPGVHPGSEGDVSAQQGLSLALRWTSRGGTLLMGDATCFSGFSLISRDFFHSQRSNSMPVLSGGRRGCPRGQLAMARSWAEEGSSQLG